MPSVRIKRSRQFYSTLSGQSPEIPAPTPPARRRSQSVVQIFSGPALDSSAEPNSGTQGRSRARANTLAPAPYNPALGSPVISRVSQHISNTGPGTWNSRNTPFLQHRSGDFSSPERTESPLQLNLQRSTSSRGHVDDAISNADVAQDDHEEAVVDHLDVIDAQVSTMSNLTNAANSMIFPPMSIYSWKPSLFLPITPRIPEDVEEGKATASEQPDNELDMHVEDVLKRQDKFRRTMKGIGSFLKTPLGVVTAIYGFCVVFWGAAIVFFLARFINLHNTDRQNFWIEVSSQTVNALFTATGVGLLPLRVMDTYRIYKIWYYKRRTRILREKAGLPALVDQDDLPDPIYDPNHVHVLTDKEQRDLHYQQYQFARSQTWYRPHGNSTHTAFPINTALLICCLIDWNSIFQIILCGTMWGLNRFQRPAWSTGILIPASFLCGIFSGVFIWRGGQKTKRTAVVEERLRLALNMGTETEKSELLQAPIRRKSSNKHLKPTRYEPNRESIAVEEHMTVPSEDALTP